MLKAMKQGEHILMAGQTGSGKTTLMENLASSRSFGIILDTKGELSIPGWEITSVCDMAFKRQTAHSAHNIFRPKSMQDVERVFTRVYKDGGWNIIVDEVYMIGTGTIKSFPPHYIRCLTAGRSRHVTVWTLTQRPKYLPLFAMTESKHIFVFELGFEDDRKYLLKNVGVGGLDEQVKGHEFLYYSRPMSKLFKTKLNLNKAA